MKLVYRKYDSNGRYVLKSFTGVIVDTLGRHRHFVNGKPIQAPEQNPTVPRLGDKHYLEDLTPAQRKKLQEKINVRLHGDDLPADYEERYSRFEQEYFKPTEDKREKEDEAIEKARKKEHPEMDKDDDDRVEEESAPIAAKIKRELKAENKAKIAAKRSEIKEKIKAVKQESKAELAKFDAEYDAVYSKIDELNKQWKAEVAKGNTHVGEFLMNGPGNQLLDMKVRVEDSRVIGGLRRVGMYGRVNDIYQEMRPEGGGDFLDHDAEYFNELKSSLEGEQDDARPQLEFSSEEGKIQKLDNELEEFEEGLKDEVKFEQELDKRMDPFIEEIRKRIEAESDAVADKWAKEDAELQTNREVEDEAARRKYGIVTAKN